MNRIEGFVQSLQSQFMQISLTLFPAVSSFVKSEDGVSLIEFALVGSLIAIVFLLGFIAFNKMT